MVNRSFKRSSRVGPLVRQVVCDVLLKKLKDPRLKGIVVTDVAVSEDLRNCRIYYYQSGTDIPIAEIKKALDSASGLFRKALSEESAMRYVPQLHFHYDEQIESARRIDALLAGIQTEQED